MPSKRHAPGLRWLAGALLAATVCTATAADTHRPAPFDAVYSVRAGGVGVGRMTRHFELGADENYRFSSIVEAEGLVAMLKPTRISEESIGQWPAAYPVTTHYAHSKKSGKKRKETIIDFDWSNARSHATINGTPVEAALEPGAIDKLSYQLALMRDLAAGVTSLSYRVADAGGGKHYTLERRANERIKAGGRAYDTVPVAYVRDDGRRTVLWCAPTLGYLPVRIEYTEKDGAVTTAELIAPTK